MQHSTAEKSFQNVREPRFIEVALPLPLRKTFTYSVPHNMRKHVRVGVRIMVPFGGRHLTGYAVALHEKLNPELEIKETSVKEVVELLDAKPLLTEDILRLTQWVSNYYMSSWGEVLKASLPSGINTTFEQMVEITVGGRKRLVKSTKTISDRILAHLKQSGKTSLRELKKKFGSSQTQRALRKLLEFRYVDKFGVPNSQKIKPKHRKAVRLLPLKDKKDRKLTNKQAKIVNTLIQNGNEMFFTELAKKTGVSDSPINTLAKHGFVKVFVKESRRDPFVNTNLLNIKDLTLTADQNEVLTQIEKALNGKKYKAFMLHGVTGGGKTEVYIRAMKSALGKGKSALMLVPEIALTPFFFKYLRSVFGNKVAILHSSLSPGERFDEWRRIRNNKARLVIGTRSAVFAPLQNLGLIIVDEEHDGSYRQHEAPFYNGRDVAVVRANFSDAVVLLGSATPALESFHNSRTGKYEYLVLPNRIANRPLAKTEVIDMREFSREKGKNQILAPKLIEAITQTHERGEQSIILLNRRGFSRFVLCRTCGETINCKNCEITLTYHKMESKLLCHYCNHQEKTPRKCPFCDCKFLYFMGEGTEQIEKLLQEKFSNMRIKRVDRDTVGRRKELGKTLEEFSQGEIDMLVGTQMIAKGHDFHNITLVGVISADAGLSLPDFRSAERTFQLLTQAAGRAGRGNLKGRVLIQTFHPEHYVLRYSKIQSYEAFYKDEIKFRKRLNYPPFTALSSILIKHPKYNYAFDNAKVLRAALDSANLNGNCTILGPAPAPLSRLKGEYRLQILVKSKNRARLRETLDFAFVEAEANFCDMKIIFVEIDPMNLL